MTLAGIIHKFSAAATKLSATASVSLGRPPQRTLQYVEEASGHLLAGHAPCRPAFPLLRHENL